MTFFGELYTKRVGRQKKKKNSILKRKPNVYITVFCKQLIVKWLFTNHSKGKM